MAMNGSVQIETLEHIFTLLLRYTHLHLSRLEPIMLKSLPIIPSRTSKNLPIVLNLFPNHYLLFLYYSFNFTESVKIMHIKPFRN